MPSSQLQIKIRLDRGRDLRLQIYEQIKLQIESGTISSGSSLPPSRDLAAHLSVARKTVAEAYQQLLTEGFIFTRGKGGTIVKELPRAKAIAVPEETSQRLLSNLSEYGNALRSLKPADIEPREGIELSLYSSNPNMENVSVKAWFERTFGAMKHKDGGGIFSGMGHQNLRRAISNYVANTRGIDCEPEQVAVFSGFPQLIDLVLRLHVSRGDRVVVEDPGYPAMRESAFAYGADIYPVPVDEHGLQVEKLPAKRAKHPCKLIFLMAAHQFPRGAVLSIERRYAILDWAARNGTVVIDDDYDSDLFFRGFAPSSLKSLPLSDLVIYVSSFKKLVPASFSVDFAILPKPYVDLYGNAMKLSVSQPSARAQATLAEFIDSGEIGRQVKRMKALYGARRQKVCESLKRFFGASIELFGAPCGLDMLVKIVAVRSDADIMRRALESGLEVRSTKEFYCQKGPRGEFLIGYGSLTDEMIEESVRRFAVAAGLIGA